MLAQIIPDPLHPALVHFPIVLLLLGAPVAIAAAFTRRAHLPFIAAALLSLGALGSIVAVQSGGEEEEIVEDALPNEAILHEHEEWAERTNATAIVAALVALGAVALTRKPTIARGLSITTAVIALAAAVGVGFTGHYGGKLVYQQGAGIHPRLATATDGNPTAGSADASSRRRHHDDDDDDDH
ncbi:DUF2231 domain-containing protein [Actomonas aquatica]|uniref:DUF2231 domain-containing protein n=1 Tax=Actomonas aquatica TaxID=2866162 RepID=A0ABZ1C4H8_9BACT|nr:DUF2231 domain-containing protein [Opitutus sp. WL0086]WRQ86223.1 DUF2231 domain-containing protein [Opitutus sp. WL0086]